MGLVTLTGNYVPGQLVRAEDILNDLTAIVNVINGNIEAINIADNTITDNKIASISGTKIVNNTIDLGQKGVLNSFIDALVPVNEIDGSKIKSTLTRSQITDLAGKHIAVYASTPQNLLNVSSGSGSGNFDFTTSPFNVPTTTKGVFLLVTVEMGLNNVLSGSTSASITINSIVIRDVTVNAGGDPASNDQNDIHEDVFYPLVFGSSTPNAVPYSYSIASATRSNIKVDYLGYFE